MRIALPLFLLTAWLSGQALAATTGDTPPQQQPRASIARTANAKPVQSATHRRATAGAHSAGTRPAASEHTAGDHATGVNALHLVRVAHVAPARAVSRAEERTHPGLGGPGSHTAEEAVGFCGTMQMPPLALRQISRGFSRGHSGIDLMAPQGSPIRAAAAGTVIYAGRYFAYGNIVDIRHADGVVTRYAHMSAFEPGIEPGSVVAAGDEIGKVGQTGHAHGPHVHFEVRLDGRAVDPRPYLGLASCDPNAPRDEILEAYAGEARPTRRLAARTRSTHHTQAPPAPRPPG